MSVRFVPSPDPVDDDRPAVLDGTTADAVLRCRFCRIEWRMPYTPKAERSLRRHYARKHPTKAQPSKLTTGDLRVTSTIETEYLRPTKGTTKRSRENRLRVSDGRVHPVTVRRIGEARQAD